MGHHRYSSGNTYLKWVRVQYWVVMSERDEINIDELEKGDKVKWNDRKQWLIVTDTSKEESAYIEGPRGGKYEIIPSGKFDIRTMYDSPKPYKGYIVSHESSYIGQGKEVDTILVEKENGQLRELKKWTRY